MQKLSKWTCHKHSENNNISNRLNVSNCSCSWSVSTHFVGYQVCTSDLEHILTVFAILSTNPSNPLFSFYTTDIYADAVQSKKEAEGHTEHLVCPILQGKKSVNCDNYSFCEYLLCFSWPGRRHYLQSSFLSFFPQSQFIAWWVHFPHFVTLIKVIHSFTIHHWGCDFGAFVLPCRV